MLLFSLLTGEQRGGGVGLSSRTKLDRTGPSFSSTVVVFSFALSSGVFGIRRASGGVALNGGCLGSEKRFRDKAKSSLSASSTPFNSVWSLPPPFLYPPFPRPRPTDKPKDRSPPDGTRPSAEEQCLPRREGARGNHITSWQERGRKRLGKEPKGWWSVVGRGSKESMPPPDAQRNEIGETQTLKLPSSATLSRRRRKLPRIGSIWVARSGKQQSRLIPAFPPFHVRGYGRKM